VVQKAELNENFDSENNHGGSSMDIMYHVGLDVQKKTIQEHLQREACDAGMNCVAAIAAIRTA
jgi:hypothetical protein